MKIVTLASCAALLAAGATALRPGPVVHSRRKTKGPAVQLSPRQLPAEPTGIQTIISPNGVNITYKEPGKEGVCETTPGVNSYGEYSQKSGCVRPEALLLRNPETVIQSPGANASGVLQLPSIFARCPDTGFHVLTKSSWVRQPCS